MKQNYKTKEETLIDKVAYLAGNLSGDKSTYYIQRFNKIFSYLNNPSLNLNKKELDSIQSSDDKELEKIVHNAKNNSYLNNESLDKLTYVDTNKLNNLEDIEKNLGEDLYNVKKIRKSTKKQSVSLKDYSDENKENLIPHLISGITNLDELKHTYDYFNDKIKNNKNKLTKKQKIFAKSGLGKIAGYLTWHVNRDLFNFSHDAENWKFLLEPYKEICKQNVKNKTHSLEELEMEIN